MTPQELPPTPHEDIQSITQKNNVKKNKKGFLSRLFRPRRNEPLQQSPPAPAPQQSDPLPSPPQVTEEDDHFTAKSYMDDLDHLREQLGLDQGGQSAKAYHEQLERDANATAQEDAKRYEQEQEEIRADHDTTFLDSSDELESLLENVPRADEDELAREDSQDKVQQERQQSNGQVPEQVSHDVSRHDDDHKRRLDTEASSETTQQAVEKHVSDEQTEQTEQTTQATQPQQAFEHASEWLNNNPFEQTVQEQQEKPSSGHSFTVPSSEVHDDLIDIDARTKEENDPEAITGDDFVVGKEADCAPETARESSWTAAPEEQASDEQTKQLSSQASTQPFPQAPDHSSSQKPSQSSSQLPLQAVSQEPAQTTETKAVSKQEAVSKRGGSEQELEQQITKTSELLTSLKQGKPDNGNHELLTLEAQLRTCRSLIAQEGHLKEAKALYNSICADFEALQDFAQKDSLRREIVSLYDDIVLHDAPSQEQQTS